MDSIKRTLSVIVKQFKRLSSDEQIDLAEWITDVLLRKTRDRSLVNEAIISLEKGEDMMMTYALERLFDEVKESGMEKGMEKGIAEGMEKGIEKAMEKVVLNMLRKGMPLESIQEVTELSCEQILALKERL